MNIAIIGAGNVGRALATSFSRAGHAVIVASRDPEHSAAVASAAHGRAAANNAEAAAAADVVVLAVPPDSLESVIYVVRGQRVMLDADLARLYDVRTAVLNQAVKRNPARFPEDFPRRLCVSRFAARAYNLDVTNCDIKMGRHAKASNGVYRARRRHAQQRLTLGESLAGQRRHHAGVRQTAPAARYAWRTGSTDRQAGGDR